MVGITLRDITKRFGHVTAVDGLSLEIDRGELFFLLGPSGCGKTTLLRVTAGFCKPDAGEVRFDDRPMTDVPPHKRNVGMVFQNYALWPHMTVFQNVSYGLEVRRVPRKERRRRVEAVLDMVHMRAEANRKPHELSGGQQQRVALARALVVEPDVVLLDEPLSNLDTRLRLQMRREIRRIHSETGVTMIYVTHDQKEALSLAQRLAVVQNGRVEQIGAPREIYRSPKSRFVAEFIGEVNLFGARVTRVNDGQIELSTPFGRCVSSYCEAEIVAGTEVLCGVRPEAVSVVKSTAPGANKVEGKLTGVTYLGEVEQLMIRLAGGLDFRVLRANPREPLAENGAVVHLAFSAEDVMVLQS